MEIVAEKCCGLDVHEATVVACVLTGAANEKPKKEIRTFSTFTRDLHALRDWLLAERCTHVAMESTGVYWIAPYAILEGHFQLVVGNASHMKGVPGRKTDAKDAEWIADLLRHGLIKPSFVPPAPIRALRDLTRYRRSLVDARSAECNRLIKVLEMANIKLAMVASDVLGVSGTLMVRQLVEGNGDLAAVAQLAKGSLRKKMVSLELALDGHLAPHQRTMLDIQLKRIDQLDAEVATLEKLIDDRLQPYRREMQLLEQIPGVDHIIAATMVAELGVDMNVFGAPEKAAAWAGVSPGNNESAGKRKGGHSRKGNIHLTTALVQAAHAASRQKGSYLRDKFWRLKARRGPKRAAVAVGRKILIAAFHMLKTGTDYKDLGDAFLDRIDETMVVTNLVRRIERLGFKVTFERNAA
jgi:transposase